MNPAMAAELLRDAIGLALTLAAPMLIAALTVGVVVSLLQAVTQVQEQSLTFLPKLLVVTAVFLVTVPFMMRGLTEFMAKMLQALPSVAR